LISPLTERACCLAIAAWVGWYCTGCEAPSRTVIIDGTTAPVLLGDWEQRDGYVESSGLGRDVVAAVVPSGEAFRVTARLRIIDQERSAAGFFFDENYFGFEGAVETIFVNGPFVDELTHLTKATEVFDREAWIVFELELRNGVYTYRINDEVVSSIESPIRPSKRIGFRPHRGTLQISRWTIEGPVTDADRPELRSSIIPHLTLPHGTLTWQDEGDDEAVTGHCLIDLAGGRRAKIEFDDRGQRTVVRFDAGEGWSRPLPLPASLQGRGHSVTAAPDGRLLITFRDTQSGSPSAGDLVLWVGTGDDLLRGREGAYRVTLLDRAAMRSPIERLQLDVGTEGALAVEAVAPAGPKPKLAGFTLDDLDALVPKRGYGIPLIDLDADTPRQVLVDRESGQYLGHPTTVLLDDQRSMIAVYPKGHGRGAIVMKRSGDAGLTWSERLPTPASWATSQEVPTIFKVTDPATGRRRLIMFSGLYPIRMAHSDDEGRTWSELESIGDFGGIVAMGCLTQTADGDCVALFHDDGRFIDGSGRSTGVFTLYQVRSTDGGMTWSAPEAIHSDSRVHLCEPGIIRSPDGQTLTILLRENSRTRNSYVMFSRDEARTWTAPRELPGALTGDRHTAVYAPDGRLFISFRDTTLESPTQGDWVGWVGTFEDIAEGREGQYRVRLMDNKHQWDCAYPGVEILPDGTIVTTTYGHWDEGQPPYIMSVRFTLDELDRRLPAEQRSDEPVSR
jgi:hypothetical protein